MHFFIYPLVRECVRVNFSCECVHVRLFFSRLHVDDMLFGILLKYITFDKSSVRLSFDETGARVLVIIVLGRLERPGHEGRFGCRGRRGGGGGGGGGRGRSQPDGQPL